MSEDAMRRAREVNARIDAMNPAAAEEMRDLIRSLSTEELKALRTELAGRTGGES
jgi:hypothetical protein